ENGVNAVFVALKVGNQYLNRATRHTLVDLSNRLGENPGSKVWQIVAIDRCYHRVLQSHLRDCFCYPMGLGDVVCRGSAVSDGAIGAIAGANVAENHECRGAVLPALAD